VAITHDSTVDKGCWEALTRLDWFRMQMGPKMCDGSREGALFSAAAAFLSHESALFRQPASTVGPTPPCRSRDFVPTLLHVSPPHDRGILTTCRQDVAANPTFCSRTRCQPYPSPAKRCSRRAFELVRHVLCMTSAHSCLWPMLLQFMTLHVARLPGFVVPGQLLVPYVVFV
jgi:hypothetical protein